MSRIPTSYIKERRGRELENASERVQELDLELQELNNQLNTIREVIAGIQKEINEGGASVANLRDNIRARRLVREISEVQAEIDSHDMEEMAKARRNFEEKYKLAKEKEDNLRVEVGIYVVCRDSLLIPPLSSFAVVVSWTLNSMVVSAENLTHCNSRLKNTTSI